MNKEKLKIEEGSINLWTKENSLNFNDNKFTPIFEINPEGGSILAIKDADNKLKFFFVVIGKGRVDIEYGVANVDPTKKHMISLTWNLKDRQLIMYFDGKNVVSKSIDF